MLKAMCLLLLCSIAVLVMAGCGGQDDRTDASPGAVQGRLILTGSSSVAPLVNEIAKRFEREHPSVRVDVQTGGSSRGIADARRGAADIGMASRALKAGESDLTAHRIAADGVGLIVQRDNPIRSLTREQIIGIYTGRVHNWSAVGGRDAPITVVSKADGRATLDVFLDHFGLTSPQIRASIIVGDNQQGLRTVAGDPNAIGYVSIGTAVYEQGQGTAIRLLPLGGVEPTTQNVMSGRFPMARPLNLVTHGNPSELAQAFIAYASSPEVHDLIRDQHFVPIEPTPPDAEPTE